MLSRLLLAVAFAAAVSTGAEARQAGQERLGPLSPGEVAKLLDAYVLVQAQEALRLNDTQYGQFVTRMKNVQEVRRRNQRLRQGILQDLRRLSGDDVEKVNEGSILERLKALGEQDERALAETRKAYEALDAVLDVRQRARFRLFEENMERRKFELLMRARQSNRQLRVNPQPRIPDDR